MEKSWIFFGPNLFWYWYRCCVSV